GWQGDLSRRPAEAGDFRVFDAEGGEARRPRVPVTLLAFNGSGSMATSGKGKIAPGTSLDLFLTPAAMPFPEEPEKPNALFGPRGRLRVGQISITGADMTRQDVIRRQVPAYSYFDPLNDAEAPGQLIVGRGPALYGRPSFTGDRHVFTDLLAY